MVRCKIAQSLKACLSVQTVNMRSEYLDVISRKSESLKPVIIETSLARRSRVVFHDDDSSTCAACGGGGKHTHPGTRWWLVRTIQSWLPLYAGGFTYAVRLGSARPRDTNGLNDELKLESGFAHIISYISEAVGLGKKMESWRIDNSGALLKNHTFWFAKYQQQQQLHFFYHNMEGAAASSDCSNTITCVEKPAIRAPSLHSHLPAELMKTRRPLPLVSWYWPKLRVFCM